MYETKVATWDDLAFKLIILGWNMKHSMDIAKISRKRSKPDKHGHRNGIECTRAGRMLSKALLSELTNKVGFLVTSTSFDALLESLLLTAKQFPQSAGYRILAS
ncbi:hypothetical protein Tco_0877106 [Tanacetum coccineum]|uniref:Uncharacterized protein n=1 Tax=Tanacetum coccineum TaxID=301880 RepID=A0ABQ5BU56_9ASTR